MTSPFSDEKPSSAARRIRMTVNGVAVEAVAEPRTTLVDFLREIGRAHV